MADKIRILKYQVIAYDGINTRGYEVGEELVVGTLNMPPEIAEALLEDGRAELVGKSHKVEEEPEEKTPAPKVIPRRPGPTETKG